ncbi:hypothetical protein GGD64_007978 [Bradyrhizobium sp. CIR3A]|nr:hypothetical protein [Bradyrhizobium sp. CIR3A]
MNGIEEVCDIVIFWPIFVRPVEYPDMLKA